MKYIFCLTIISLFISSCDESTVSKSKSGVWGSQSQRIVIERFDGLSFDEADRYILYDLARDDIPDAALHFLGTIGLEELDLSCHQDGVSYDVTITGDNGIEKNYYSSNKSCNHLSDPNARFIAVDDLNTIIQLL